MEEVSLGSVRVLCGTAREGKDVGGCTKIDVRPVGIYPEVGSKAGRADEVLSGRGWTVRVGDV